MSSENPPDNLPKLTRREWDKLGTLFLPIELGGKWKLGPKIAQKFVQLGLVEYFEETLPAKRGQPAWTAIKITGYRLTSIGHYCYCRWAGTQPLAPEDELCRS